MSGNVFVIVKKTYKPIVALIAVILFFAFYNAYLIDHSLDSLKLALTQTASAQTLEETESLQTLIDYALISELTAYKMNSGNLADLTRSRNITTKGKSTEQIKDMELALKEIIKRREKQRGVILTSLDRFVNGVRNIKNKIEIAFLIKKPKVAIAVDTSYLDKAKALEEAWELSEAIENYKLFIASYPNYEHIDVIRLKLAYSYEKSKNYLNAEKIYERIIKISRGTNEAQVAQAKLIQLKEMQALLVRKARLTAKIAKLKDTSDLQEAYYQLGTVNSKLLDFPSAQNNYVKVVELNPDTELALKAQFNLGWSYKFQNKMEESSEAFEKIATLAPESELATDSKYQVANNLEMQDRYKEALDMYKQISQQHKDETLAKQALLQTGYTYLYDLEDPTAAKIEFDKISRRKVYEVSKDIGKEYRLQGYALLDENRYAEAKKKFDTAITLNPKDSSAYVGISRTYQAMNNPEKAIEVAEEGSQINPDDEYIFATLGELFSQTNRYSEAINAYKESIAIRGDYTEALYNLGYLYNLTSQYDEAIEALEKAVKIMPSYAEAYNNLGVAYWKKNRTKDAIRALLTATKLNPRYIHAFYNLGLIYKSEGQTRKAKQTFLRILDISPQELEAKKELRELEGK